LSIYGPTPQGGPALRRNLLPALLTRVVSAPPYNVALSVGVYLKKENSYGVTQILWLV